MEDLREPGPDDVVATAEASYALLSPLAEKDWSVIAGDLEWDCRQTLDHVAFVQLFYATSAADPSLRRLPTARINNSGPVHRRVGKRPPRVEQRPRRSAPRHARGRTGVHPAGLADRYGFAAMACTETLVHTWDIACGLGVDFTPPEDIAAKSLARLFPWVQDDGDPWQTLLYAAGRRNLRGNDRRAPNWSWQCAPLSEWKGDIRGPRRVGTSLTLPVHTELVEGCSAPLARPRPRDTIAATHTPRRNASQWKTCTNRARTMS